MQPVNEALLTDEEFLALTAKKIEGPVRDQGMVALNAESVQRLLDIISKQEKEILLASDIFKPALQTVYLPTLGSPNPNPMITMERPVANKEGYRDLRLRHKKIDDDTYEVTLGVVNRPCGSHPQGVLFAISRKKLIKIMDRFVGKPIGELSHSRISIDMGVFDNITDRVNRHQTIEPAFCALWLKDYEISDIRDGSSSLAIVGTIRVRAEGAAMIESGQYVFGMRSSTVTDGQPGNVLEDIHGFDFLPACDLNTTI